MSLICITLDNLEVIHHHPVFVKDTSKYWYKPNITREDGKLTFLQTTSVNGWHIRNYLIFFFLSAINALKDKPPGTFIVRDSNSFPGAYGLALKVATPPPNIQNKSGTSFIFLTRFWVKEDFSHISTRLQCLIISYRGSSEWTC